MKNLSARNHSGRTSMVSLLVVATALILLAVTARHQLTGFAANQTAATTATGTVDHDTRITRLNDPAAAEINRRKTSNSGRSALSGSRSATSASGQTTASIAADSETTVSDLHGEKYILALLAQQEKDGKDNALLHYALAFELAPDPPTEEQKRLIKQVMEEGWDARADSLLPYIKAWEAAFREIEAGAALDYARGVGFEKGFDTPLPNFLMAQSAGRVLAAYSAYLASKGEFLEAQKYIGIAFTMGRDLMSLGNTAISHLVGTAITAVGLRQLSALTNADQLGGNERAIIQTLQNLENSQITMSSMMDVELQKMMIGLQLVKNRREKALEGKDPEFLEEMANFPMSIEQAEQMYKDAWDEHSDYFVKPYWERSPAEYLAMLDELDPLGRDQIPSFGDAEARLLSNTSRMRQQQIDLAARLYVADHNAPPSNVSALVSGDYLPAEPVDPFTGQAFNYQTNGNSYTLYGSGPNIETPNDPNVNYTPVNGTYSEGVIRVR